jgi:type I site-specific restriction endonuclease
LGRDKPGIVRDPVRKKYLVDGPEERVRQGVVRFLIERHRVPAGLIAIEQAVAGAPRSYRFDIVVHDSTGKPWMVVECKAPAIRVGQQGFDQIGRYNYVLKAPFMMITNGTDNYCCSVNESSGELTFLDSLPVFPTGGTST